MRHINLTKDEVILLINSVQRTIIKLENYDDSSELTRKHRLLLKTLLEIEDNLSTIPKKEPIRTYK